MRQENIDAIVNDARWSPYSGWYIEEEMQQRGDGWHQNRSPSIQQVRSEFLSLVSALETKGITGGRMLQIGLGTPGASHVVWKELFREAYSLEFSEIPIDEYKHRGFDAAGIIWGNSQDPEILQHFASRPLDFLLIDGDHAYDNVKTDFFNWSPLVREGGVIAFHDSLNYPFYSHHFQVSKFVSELESIGISVQRIESKLGIAYLVKNDKEEALSKIERSTLTSPLWEVPTLLSVKGGAIIQYHGRFYIDNRGVDFMVAPPELVNSLSNFSTLREALNHVGRKYEI